MPFDLDPTLVGLMADSHDNREGVEAAARLFMDRQVGLVLHAGDYIAPFTAGWMAGLSAPLVGVFGNNDGERFGLRVRYEALGAIHRPPYRFEHGGKRFLLLHEPDEVDALAQSGTCDIIVYGHTHAVDVRPGKTLVVNPGETGGWTTGRMTAGILDLSAMTVQIVDLPS